jgi:small subunit ribosomal protein S10
MKIRLVLKSFYNSKINLASNQLQEVCKKTDAIYGGIVALPTRIKRYCVLRSPHIDKDSREHFEVRVYKRFLDLTTDSTLVLDSLLHLELPSGVACSLKIINY